MRKILIVLGILVIGGGLVWGGIYFRSRIGGSSTGTGAESSTGGSLPVAGGDASGGNENANGAGSGEGALPGTELKATLSGPILDYFLEANGGLLTVNLDGQISRITPSNSTLISNNKLEGILRASFSPYGKRVLFEVQSVDDPLSRRFTIYDIDKNAWREVLADTRDVAWSPDGNKIAILERRQSKTVLSTLDLTKSTSKPQTLLSLAAQDLSINWISSTRLILGERGSGAVPGSLWSFDLSTRALRLIREDISGAALFWSGAQGLLFGGGVNGAGGTLTLVDSALKDLQTFSFLTLPSKCGFEESATSSVALVCAIPKDSRTLSAALLPDDYNKKAVMTADTLYAINLETSSFKPILENPTLIIDAEKIKFGKDRVYFINRWDGRLYSIELPQNAFEGTSISED